jgi:hypothetical protein
VGAFVLLAGFVVFRVVLLVPLILPGALVVFVVIGLRALKRPHHSSGSLACQ